MNIINSVQAITVNEPATPQTASNVKGSNFKNYRDAAMKEAKNETAAEIQSNMTQKTDDAQERFKNLPNANSGQNIARNKSGQDTASDEPQDETKTDFSICCDSPYYSLLNGIVGILEGFGLLNEETGNIVSTDELGKIIAKAFENVQNAVITDDAAATKAVMPDNKFSETVARMPKTDQTNTLQLAQGEIEDLVEEYLCSFANVNKKGAEEKNLSDQGINFPTSQDTLNASEADTSKIKLQFMLKNAQEHLKLLLINAEEDPELLLCNIKERLKMLLSNSEEQPGLLISNVKERLSLHLSDKNSEANGIAQDVKDNVLLMVKEAPKGTNTKDMKDNQGAAKSDVSFKNGSVFASGVESKSGQAINETGVSQPEKEMPAAKTIQDNMERIIQKMTVSLKEGKQHFEVALKPEYLGKLSIKLMMDNDGIKAHIKAADTSVKGMIAEQLPALQEALKEKGLTVTHIEVSYERPAFENQQSHHQNWQNNNHQKSMRYAVSDPGSVTYEMMSEIPELLANYSSVEFQA